MASKCSALPGVQAGEIRSFISGTVIDRKKEIISKVESTLHRNLMMFRAIPVHVLEGCSMVTDVYSTFFLSKRELFSKDWVERGVAGFCWHSGGQCSLFLQLSLMVPSPATRHLVRHLIVNLPSKSKQSLIPLLSDHLPGKL